jgi:2-dehydro-3-deoxy-D-gluconate 5-dehydrogenase
VNGSPPGNTPFDLSGRTALVTGCRRGIGRGAALALAQAGADIVGVSAALEPDGGEVGAAVTALGRGFRGYRCDVADREALYAFIAEVSDAYQRLDVLVLNAGTIARKPAVDHDDAIWDRVIEVNLTAQFVLARELGRRMVEQRSGKIVFVASLLAYQGGVTVPGYAASKGGIAQLTKALANEWATLGVNVNAIAPGYIRTDNTQALQDDEVRSRQILDRIPAGRWGVPDDLGGAFVFLASPASDYVHGIVLPVDGGWLGR